MKIKTFPLQFTEIELDSIRIEAQKRNMSIKAFIHMAIENELSNKPMKSK